jgi:hypothetical protein
LDFELGSGMYDFSLYLFNDSTEALPYFVSAIDKMIKEIGLGRDRKVYNDFRILVNGGDCKVEDEIKIPKNFVKEFTIDNFCPDVLMQFVTPLRIKRDNRYVRGDFLELFDIINSAYQRYRQIIGKDRKRFPVKVKGEIVKRSLKFIEIDRVSNRQKSKMKFGGLVGEIFVKNLDKNEYELLKIGELIGVGKQTVFGLGKIKIEGE